MYTNNLYALRSRGCLVLTFSMFWFFSSTLHPIVILVHGSFGASQDWWKPGGDFFTSLEIQAKMLGHKVVPFCWSGKPTEHEINAAAGVLAKLVISYPAQERIVLVGHSNGGNVINKATQLLYDPLPELLAYASSRPILEMLVQVHDLIVTQSECNQKPCVPIPRPCSNNYCTLDLSPTLREVKSYLIEKVYLLGTPVCVEKYHPQMKVVGGLINLFSEGDFIQPVLGLYQRRYPSHDRISNIEIRFMVEGQYQPIKPGHSALHDQLVGRWLLHLPDMLKKEEVGNVILPTSIDN